MATRAGIGKLILLNLFYNGVMDDDLLTAPQVAKILHVTSASVNRWCKQGLFPNASRINPFTKSPWRIPRGDVDLFKQKRREQYGWMRLPLASQEEPEQLELISS